MAINSKLTNVLGVKMPFWIINQLDTRANRGALSQRNNNDNLLYLANKTAWVRLVSSVDIVGQKDFNYFKIVDPSIKNPSDLAKNYMLFGGTSKYLKDKSYELRWGLHGVDGQVGGSYGMLGESEVQDFGYRPMPGITRVNIDTQGRLGSVRQAVIDIKCWNKAQLDVIDALYFKLGYTMFIEWGHTYYYPNKYSDSQYQNPFTALNSSIPDSTKLLSSEFMSLDPFAENTSKEELLRMISFNSRKSFGNYDAMLGMVTNFSFSLNQEGGYDCTLRLMGLGVLGDTLRINNPSKLINLLTDEVLLLNETVKLANPPDPKDESDQQADQERNDREAYSKNYQNQINKFKTDGVFNVPPNTYLDVNETRNQKDINKLNYVGNYGEFGTVVYISRLEELLPLNLDYAKQIQPQLNTQRLSNIFQGIQQLELKNRLPTISDSASWKKMIMRSEGDSLARAYTQDDFPKVLNFLPPTPVKESGKVRDQFGQIGSITIGDGSYWNYNSKQIANNGVYVRYKEFEREPFSYELYTNFLLGINVLQEGDLNRAALNALTEKNLVENPSQNFETEYIKSSLSSTDGKIYFNALDNVNIGEFGDIYTTIGQKILDQQVQNLELQYIETQPGVEYFDPKAAGQTIFAPRIFFTFKGKIVIENVPITVTIKNLFDKNTAKTLKEDKVVTIKNNLELEIYIRFTDTDLIQSLQTSQVPGLENANKSLRLFQEQKRLEAQQAQQQQQNEKNALLTQISEALGIQSNLEISLRTIQVRALNSAFYQNGADKVDLDIGKKVFEFDLTRPVRNVKNITKNLAKTVFSNGLYENMIDDLIAGRIQDSVEDYFGDEEKRLKINAKYGFATTLMGSDSENYAIFEKIKGKEVDYRDILRAFVVPYKYSADLVAGITVNHPVYVPFGLLLMLLNHSCTLYEDPNNSAESTTSSQGKSQKPVVYIDYNNKLNFFQTCPQQMSTNPWTVLMKVECSKDEYLKLFNPDVLDKNKTKIKKISNAENTENNAGELNVFNPQQQDVLSLALPRIKVDKNYTGNLMNILLNVDYLIETIRSNSAKDSTNGVYLKPFLEEILTQVNKHLGNFNAFRLNYSDKANTFQIVDDQYIDTDLDISVQTDKQQQESANATEIPLVGRYSVAKSLTVKTEMGSKLANLIAVSANSPQDQSQNSVNADSVGFINDNYLDRIVSKRVASGNITGSQNGEIAASQQFNKTIQDFYSTIEPSKNDVSQATSFLIEKISKVKSQEPATRATAMIPLGVEFTTDGIGGMSMYQTFTVSDNLLPYNYYSPKSYGFIDNQQVYVGFVVTGLTHTIEGNTWTTSVRSNMIPVKAKTAFKGDIIGPEAKSPIFGGSGNLPSYVSPQTSVVPNANSLREKIKSSKYSNRLREKGSELSNWGDITKNLSEESFKLFSHLLDKFPEIGIIITGGNDVFHVNNTKKDPNYRSPHYNGRGLDFVIWNKNFTTSFDYQTPEGKKILDEVDQANKNYLSQLKLITQILNEYVISTKFTSGGHFHITSAV